MLSTRGLISKVLKCGNNARPFEKKRGEGHRHEEQRWHPAGCPLHSTGLRTSLVLRRGLLPFEQQPLWSRELGPGTPRIATIWPFPRGISQWNIYHHEHGCRCPPSMQGEMTGLCWLFVIATQSVLLVALMCVPHGQCNPAPCAIFPLPYLCYGKADNVLHCVHAQATAPRQHQCKTHM